MRVLNVALTLKSHFLTEIKISLKTRYCFQEQEKLKARAVPGAIPGDPGAVGKREWDWRVPGASASV